MKKPRILILGGNYYPEPTGIGKYNAEMLDWLAQQGFDCSIITTYPYYPHWRIQIPYEKKSYWYKKEIRKIENGDPISVYRCPHYVPQIPTGLKRVLSDISFFISAFFQLTILLFKKEYHFVMVVSPPFQLGLLGLFYRAFKDSKLIYHIQDLQIDAAVELGMIKSHHLARIMFGFERLIIRKSNFVSSISVGMINKIKSKCDRPVLLFPNWADTNMFFPIYNKDELKIKFNFLPTDKVVMYSGAIGEKQGLQSILFSAMELREASNIKFIICGSGPYKDRLVDMANKFALPNVIFMPLQSTEKFNEFLNIADVHLILQKSNENELFLPSKLTTICAVGGLAVVTAPKNTSLFNLMIEHDLGILAIPEDQISLTAAIKSALYLDHSKKKASAREFAENYLSIDKVMYEYFKLLEYPMSSFHAKNQAGMANIQNSVTSRYFSLNKISLED